MHRLSSFPENQRPCGRKAPGEREQAENLTRHPPPDRASIYTSALVPKSNGSHIPMNAFIDPRDDLGLGANRPPARTTTAPEDLTELHRLCREGRLYDVERWIRAGRPLQIAQGTLVKRPRLTSGLDIAV